jgi:para-nitrobenzyl esterase
MSRRSLQSIFLGAIGAAVLACGDEPPPEPPQPAEITKRTLGQGVLVGAIGSHASHAWRGIPYAKPPTGELRWRAPLAPEPWEGTLEAVADGSLCPQFASPFGGANGEEASAPIGDEDCLVLNVFAPPFPAEEVPTGTDRLPVMLWIHGGGNTIGSNGFYDGGHLATAHGVVLVAINYRLGAFGWFTHPALRGAGTSADDRSGNYGTLDLVRALEWVRDNASAFGGDPGNVTIFGESAGGTNVVTLLVSKRARGLFHRAIVQSGGLSSSAVAEAENYADAPDPGHVASSREVLLKLLSRDDARKDASEPIDQVRSRLDAMSDPDISTYLRSLSAKAILSAYDGGGMGGMYSTPTVIRDGHVLPAEPFGEVFARADGPANVPVMLGTNRDENKLFLLFSSDHIRRAFGLPLWAKDQAAYDLEAEYQAKMWKADGADEPAQAMRTVRDSGVFVYRFDWDEEPKVLTADLSKLLGAAHALEIPFVFGNFDLGRGNRFLWEEERTPGRDELSEAMMSYWTEFALHGDPGQGRDSKLPPWTGWDSSTPDSPKFIVLDTRDGGGLRMSDATVTAEGLIASIATDDRFPGDRERCALYRGFVEWSGRMTAEEYETVADGACRSFPLSDPAPGS